MMRPIFCGNFDFEARSSDLERLFKRYGTVDRVDMKSGFAFIYMEDERDAEYAIRALDHIEYGRKGRRLRVEWTKHERGGSKPVSTKKSANLRPSKTLFVINFPYQTQTRDLERHFDPYGKIANVRIRKNFAFVQYEFLEDAIKALEATNMSKFLDRVITVEYSARGDDDDNRRNGRSPDRRDRDRSPDRRRRSPSPHKRLRRSPDYGAGSSPLAYRRERASPVYGNKSSRSPRRVERGSLDYNRKRSVSPRRDRRASPVYRGHGRDRSTSRSPRRVEKNGDAYGRQPSLNASDVEEGAILDERNGKGYGRQASLDTSDREEGAILDERNGKGYGRQPSLDTSDREEGAILDDDPEPASPIGKSISRDRPIRELRSPVDERYSRSPPRRERSQS